MREMQTEPIMRYQLTPVRMSVIIKSKIPNIGKDVEKRESSCTLVSDLAQLCPTLATSGTVAYNVPLSMGLSRQEYWSGVPLPFPEDLPNPGIEPGSSLL